MLEERAAGTGNRLDLRGSQARALRMERVIATLRERERARLRDVVAVRPIHDHVRRLQRSV